MFAFGGRAVCPSCKRPLWRCLCRLPYSLLLNWTSSNDDTNATVADLGISEAEILLDFKGLKERVRKKERLLDCWILGLEAFHLHDLLRLRGKFENLRLPGNRGMLSWTFRADGRGSLSSRMEDKADGKTESL